MRKGVIDPFSRQSIAGCRCELQTEISIQIEIC